MTPAHRLSRPNPLVRASVIAVAAAGALLTGPTPAPAAPGDGAVADPDPARVNTGPGRLVFDGALSLQGAVDFALEENLALQIARSDVDSAGEDIQVQKAAFDPEIVVDAAHNDRRSPSAASDLDGADRPQTENSTVGAAVQKQIDTGAELSLRSELFDRSRTNSSFARINPEYNSAVRLSLRQPLLKDGGKTVTLAPLRQAGLAFDRAQLELQDELNRVLLDTEEAYWTLVAQASTEEIRRQGLELSSIIVEEATERKRANLATTVDLLESQSSAAERNEALLVATAATMEAKDRLFRVMGILDTTEPGGLDLQPLPIAAVGKRSSRESFERALVHAPESLLYQNAIRSREIDLAVARRNRLPGLDLGLSTGLLGRSGSSTGVYDRVADRDGYFWEASVEFRLPWGFRLEKAQLAKAKEALDRALIDRQNAELQLYTDIRAAVRQVDLARERIDAASVTSELSSLRFEQTVEERKAGEATMRDLLEAQDEMEEARLRVVRAQVDLLRADAALSQLEGTLPQRHGIAPLGDPGGSGIPRATPVKGGVK